jgi:hypothetical protein
MAIPLRRRFLVFFCVLIGVSAVAAWLAVEMQKVCVIDRATRVEVEQEGVLAALQNYKAQFGQYPSGDSSAIFSALRGQNPQNIKFLAVTPESTSPDGSELDPWGTPYKIYFSSNQVLIRSAGPNKRFDDTDNKNFDDHIRASDH